MKLDWFEDMRTDSGAAQRGGGARMSEFARRSCCSNPSSVGGLLNPDAGACLGFKAYTFSPPTLTKSAVETSGSSGGCAAMCPAEGLLVVVEVDLGACTCTRACAHVHVRVCRVARNVITSIIQPRLT